MKTVVRKSPEADLKRSYQLHLEIGFVIALALLVAVFKADLSMDSTIIFDAEQVNFIPTELPPVTEQQKAPLAPPKPFIPVEVNDDTPEGDPIEIGDFDDDVKPLPLPPPPASEETPEDEPQELYKLERQPELVGSMSDLQKSVVYPEMAIRAGVEGRVVIEFVIDERGRVTNARVVRGIGVGCDEAALAAVQKARFKPGMQRGRPVKVRYNIPIQFKLKM